MALMTGQEGEKLNEHIERMTEDRIVRVARDKSLDGRRAKCVCT